MSHRYIVHLSDDKGLYKFDAHFRLVVGIHFKDNNSSDYTSTKLPKFKFQRNWNNYLKQN